jgi:dTDP-4-amino-4,6-dideoxygalactose transaminase
MIPFINLRKQYDGIRDEILDATDMVYRSGVHMNGPYTHALEEQLAKRLGMEHVICVHSGTQALEMVAAYHRYSFGIEADVKEPRVCIPAITYPATINAWIKAGWEPILIDVDAYGIMDLNKLPDYQDYHAICMVGLYGQPVWDELFKSNHEKIRWKILVEDAAQHWLSEPFGQTPMIKAISFDPMKNLGNYGNGGAIATYDPDAANWFRKYRDNGKPDWAIVGTNSRMSETDAAQLLVKLKYIDQWQDRRRNIATWWIDEFEGIEEIRPVIRQEFLQHHALQKFVVDINDRNAVKDKMYNDGVECKIHYERPLHELPRYEHYDNPGPLSVASSLSRRCLSLPLYPELTDNEVEYISDYLVQHVTHCSNH